MTPHTMERHRFLRAGGSIALAAAATAASGAVLRYRDHQWRTPEPGMNDLQADR